MDFRKILLIMGIVLFLASPAWAGAGGGGLFSPNPGLAIWTLITFIVLLTVLRIFAWKPLIESLEKRTAYIENLIKDAEGKNRTAEERLREYEQKIEQAKAEALQIVQEGKRDAEAFKKRNMEETRQELEVLKEQTRKEIGLAKKQAQEELWNMVVELSTAMAEKIIERSLGSEDDRRIIEAVLQEYRKN